MPPLRATGSTGILGHTLREMIQLQHPGWAENVNGHILLTKRRRSLCCGLLLRHLQTGLWLLRWLQSGLWLLLRASIRLLQWLWAGLWLLLRVLRAGLP